MNESEKLSNELSDIKQIMERSSRFISLSGLSGIAAGTCALIGTWFAADVIQRNKAAVRSLKRSITDVNLRSLSEIFGSRLFQIAILTLIAAMVSAFIFTYRRSKKANVPVWGTTARRLTINVLVPMITGGIFLMALIQNDIYGFIAPGCLIFYGLGVLNASKYTLPETRYLGYGEILLGLINLFFVGEGLYFWAAGFGVLHIVYGIFMWWKYERN
ncbi:MAG: hypothetical protein JST21_05365 [Bacteroidetes bacterium]|nr:hypothetical protein [Bacteroidota bacterium]